MRERVNWLAEAVAGIGVLAVASRRWSAPLMASALGFGLCIGVAFGPGTDGVGATGSQIVAVGGGETAPAEETVADAGGGSTSATASGGAGDGRGTASASTAVTPAPFTPAPLAPVTPLEEPAPLEPVEELPVDEGTTDPGTDPLPEPEIEDSSLLAGTVVHVNPAASSYALAVRGEPYAVHARKLPEPGDQLEVALSELANGTYAEDGERTLTGTTSSGSVNGFVTYVSGDDEPPAYTVSARGVSVLVRIPAAGDPSELPGLGDFVSAGVAINDPASAERRTRQRRAERQEEGDPAAGSCVREQPVEVVEPEEKLVQRSIEPTGEAFTYFDLAGTVQAICPETGELLISADDIRSGGVDLLLKVPSGIDIGKLEVDQPVLATAELDENGVLSLAGVAADDGLEDADDPKQLQGDFAG